MKTSKLCTFSIFMLLAGCGQATTVEQHEANGPQSAPDPELSTEAPVMTRVPGVGDFAGRGRFQISPYEDDDSVLTLNVTGGEQSKLYTFGFSVTLEPDQTKPLLAGERVALDGGASVAWGPIDANVWRPLEGLKLAREPSGNSTLELYLGERLGMRDGADAALGDARTVFVRGEVEVMCSVRLPGAGTHAVADDISLRSPFCREALAKYGFEPSELPGDAQEDLPTVQGASGAVAE